VKARGSQEVREGFDEGKCIEVNREKNPFAKHDVHVVFLLWLY